MYNVKICGLACIENNADTPNNAVIAAAAIQIIVFLSLAIIFMLLAPQHISSIY